jgi:hypothetical protein
MSGKMIIKLLSILAEIVRQKTIAARPQSRLQKGFEWQSEFLFVPEKRPFHPVSLVPLTCSVCDLNNSYLRHDKKQRFPIAR